ncbi:MAG: DUF4293 domain-containing protein [Flavobacteriaceae bacterium]|jgi:drug/metabolite transporter (DMT)-like permease|nr:DUF4293 domain-containing protein [Flavobacteriaceae bacterium]
MLQRIQTVWIAFAVLASVFLYMSSDDVQVFDTNIPVIGIGSFAVGIIGILSIFSFKNRKRQIVLNRLSIVINALLIGVLMYWLLNLSGGIEIPEKGIEPVFPALAIIFLAIANRFIRKDERLVKSVDRLR